MLSAVAACPHPPLLVPAVAAGAAPELDDLRAACAVAVHRLLASGLDLVCVVGDGTPLRWYDEADTGSFRPYGVPLDVPPGGAADRSPVLPLSLTVGAWLLDGAGWTGPRRLLGLPPDLVETELGRLGGQIAGLAPAVGLLVMGDGSARRTQKAPGYLDPRSEAFDKVAARALATADTAALAALDPELGAALLAAGTTPWRLLAHAAAGADWAARLLVDTVPYGVAYFVASWVRS